MKDGMKVNYNDAEDMLWFKMNKNTILETGLIDSILPFNLTLRSTQTTIIHCVYYSFC